MANPPDSKSVFVPIDIDGTGRAIGIAANGVYSLGVAAVGVTDTTEEQ